MDAEKTTFLRDILPAKLRELKADQAPAWGLMGAQHMVEHLGGAIMMSLGKTSMEPQYTEEKLPRRLQWMRSGMGFQKSVPQPGKKVKEPNALRFATLEEAKEKLIGAVDKFYADFAGSEAEKTTLHPYFGQLNGVEWEHFHYKHTYHHLSQFGLVPEKMDLRPLA